jgi:hypothetical protein
LINGKKLSTFKEIVFFHDNFSSILSSTKNVVAKQQDDLISALTVRESTEHYTPQYILDAVIAYMEAIDLDPCSNSQRR